MIVDIEKPEGKQMLQIPASSIVTDDVLEECNHSEDEFLSQFNNFLFNPYLNGWMCTSNDCRALKMIAKKHGSTIKIL